MQVFTIKTNKSDYPFLVIADGFKSAGRPRTTDVEGYALIHLNNAEWHAVDTLVRHLYKHRGTMLKRLWQRNRNLFPEV